MPIKPAAECKYAEVDQIKEIHEQVNLTYVGPSVETSGANFGATMVLDPAGTSDACAAMADASRAPISVQCPIGQQRRSSCVR